MTPSEAPEDDNDQRYRVAGSEENGESNDKTKLQSPGNKQLGASTDDEHGGIAAWIPEIWSICVAICCLIAIFTLLARFDGQRQPDWPYASALNLSTLIALVATILRSMLATVIDSVIGQMKWRWYQASPRPLSNITAFDDASRGVWGSTKFLWTLFRLNLATLGALIMVLSVVTGTFTQQALQTTSCQRVNPQGKASIPVAQGGTTLNGLQRTSHSDSLFELTTDLRASLIAGLSESKLTAKSKTSSFSPTCTTGNCTFKATNGIAYSSSAFSVECVDVSYLITQEGLRSWKTPNNYTTGGEATNYTLPTGLTIQYSLVTEGWHESGGRWNEMLVTGSLDAPGGQGPLVDNMTMTARQQEIANISFDGVVFLMPTRNPCLNATAYQEYMADGELNAMPAVKADSCPQLDLPNVNTLPGFFSVTAAACFFYASVQHYNGSVVNGELEETVQDRTPMGVAKMMDEFGGLEVWRFGFSDPCIVDDVIYTNTSQNFSSVPGGLVTYVNITAPKRCFYGFSYYWYRALVGNREALYTLLVPNTDDTCFPFANYTSMICTKNWWLSGIFNGGNATTATIHAFMQAGFESLTSQWRTMGTDWDNNVATVVGVAYETDVCTKFRREWLVYPLVMVAGTVLLLCLAITSGSLKAFRHDGKKETIWKSSALPLLFYGLQDQDRKTDATLCSEKQLSQGADRMRVGFARGEDGWRFRSPK